jgi:hypothetical protein
MTEFHYSRRPNRHRVCKVCSDKRQRVTRARNPEKYTEKSRWRSIKRKYGLSKQGFLDLLESQEGVCAICRLEMAVPHVDHDHDSNKVRGLLCFTCNTALGKFHDSTEMLESAINYLKKDVA